MSSCPVCGGGHESCQFGPGSLYCVKTACGNPHHRPDPVAEHFQNFVDCVRARKPQALAADVEEGFMSTALCHLANISYRVGRALVFDGKSERFVNDAEANKLLTRDYREPFVVPEKV